MTQFSDPTGYNRAEAQFHEKDERLLRELRGKLDEKRKETAAAQARGPHWMKCPKCGGDLKEVQQKDVLIDQCQSCGGVFFDPGELTVLLRHDWDRAGGMLKSLFGWLPNWSKNVEKYSPLIKK